MHHHNYKPGSRTRVTAPRASAPSLRQLRIGETMRRILAELLGLGNLAHPDLRRLHVTVTEVRVGPDLSNARVFLMPLGGEDNQAALNALEQSRGLLRTQLATQMRLKRAPALTFELDGSFDSAREIDRLLSSPKVARDLQTPTALPISLPAETPSGWLILDKPSGITSARAVAEVKKLTGAAKAGHCGTLDPAAEGLLPIALGEATKLIPFLADASKTYRFTLAWGVATSSDDSEGDVVATSSLRPDRENIQCALQGLVGEMEQLPPRYSALRVSGTRAYMLARAGKEFELAPRRVRLHSAVITEAESGADRASFEITCSKGFYVRALARDLGVKLGTCAHVVWLRRTRVGMFSEEMSIPLELKTELRDNQPFRELEEERRRLLEQLQPLESVLENVSSVAVDAVQEARLRQGQAVFLTFPGSQEDIKWGSSRRPLVALREGKVVALLRRAEGEDKKVWPVRVLHTRTGS